MNNFVFLIIPESEWKGLLESQLTILEEIKTLKAKNDSIAIPLGFITAKEFMATIRIGRTKFDQLVLANKIKTIKKRRKIYVPVTEIDRYFKDTTIP